MDNFKNFLLEIRIEFKKIMMKLKTGIMGSKPKRPRIQKILIAEIVDDEIIFNERFIIVNVNGETLDAPIFATKMEASNWLDEHHPANKYDP